MDGLTNISTIKELMERHGFHFSKALGQNFIVNPSVCPRIAEMGGAVGCGVLEIGAGFGVLTDQLARVAQKVVCVEIDQRLLPVLDETLAEYDNVTIVNKDVMETDLKALIAEHFEGMEVVVCANLPYYITSPILMRLLEEDLPVKSITVMVQKEAGERICARPGTRQSGALTAAVWFYSEPRQLFHVSRGSFMPAPDVDSSVIRLDVRAEAPVEVTDKKDFFRVVKAAFAQRRKTVHNSLASSLGISKDRVGEAMDRAGVARNARAEQLGLEEFAAIANAMHDIFKEGSK
ncbi:MAG: 16S rRNA (adenine(1518)-N(6)/adenine(1519)-N(6))-dimethyltransferase RsmA [Oscillospiraceae bacterium]|nr:16S rRNA (adenine(1518)-N(6)/adenine(1519)-N(6))-dimethyltransferase RsmA [Oscillospiraceae bacterium]